MANPLFVKGSAALAGMGDGWSAPADMGGGVAKVTGPRGYSIHGNPSCGFTVIRGEKPVTEPMGKAPEAKAAVNRMIAADIEHEKAAAAEAEKRREERAKRDAEKAAAKKDNK